MTPNLNPSEVVAWMREQAQQFNKMAEQLESTFNLNGHHSPELDESSKVSLEDLIINLLQDQTSRRVTTIAKDLGLSERAVDRSVRRSQRLQRNERGWITVKIGGGDDG